MLSEDKKKRGGNLVGQEMKKEMNMSRETFPELLITVTRFHNISMTKDRFTLVKSVLTEKKNANEVALVKGKAELFVATRKNCKWSDTSQG